MVEAGPAGPDTSIIMIFSTFTRVMGDFVQAQDKKDAAPTVWGPHLCTKEEKSEAEGAEGDAPAALAVEEHDVVPGDGQGDLGPDGEQRP